MVRTEEKSVEPHIVANSPSEGNSEASVHVDVSEEEHVVEKKIMKGVQAELKKHLAEIEEVKAENQRLAHEIANKPVKVNVEVPEPVVEPSSTQCQSWAAIGSARR